MDEEGIAVGRVPHVGFEGGGVFVGRKMVRGVGVARCVRQGVDSGGGADGTCAAYPVRRADGGVRSVGTGAVQPCFECGLHLDIAGLLSLGDVCGDVDVAVTYVAPL